MFLGIIVGNVGALGRRYLNQGSATVAGTASAGGATGREEVVGAETVEMDSTNTPKPFRLPAASASSLRRSSPYGNPPELGKTVGGKPVDEDSLTIVSTLDGFTMVGNDNLPIVSIAAKVDKDGNPIGVSLAPTVKGNSTIVTGKPLDIVRQLAQLHFGIQESTVMHETAMADSDITFPKGKLTLDQLNQHQFMVDLRASLPGKTVIASIDGNEFRLQIK